MSAFTEWNGPPATRGPSTKDVLALIEAYNNLNTTLVKHLAGTWVDDVHGFRTAFNEAIEALEKSVNEAIAGKAEADDLASLENAVSVNTDTIAAEAERAEAAEDSLRTAIDAETERAAGAETDLLEAVNALEDALAETKETFSQALSRISFDDEDTTTVAGILAATEYLVGMLKARKLIDFVEWETITAQYAGTGANDSVTRTHGIYILGRLSEEWDPDKGLSGGYRQKSARAFIKYVNDRPFDIIVDITASGGKNGTLSCVASFDKEWTVNDTENAWEDVALHLVKNTDSSGDSHVYLGISAKGLYGQPVIFHIAGVNFIAGGTVNGISTSIGAVRVKQGFNAYRANFDDLRVTSLNDIHGDAILSVTLSPSNLSGAYKVLYIADDTYSAVYFNKRPSVTFYEDNGDGTQSTKVAPVLTGYDLDALGAGGSIKGIIVFWPQWEEAVVNGVTVKRAVNYPEGWIACDGSTVSTADYPTLIEILGLAEGTSTATLPLMDYAIMRLTNLFDNVELDDGSKVIDVMSHLELQEAVLQLQDDLEDESAEREAADTALQSAIDAEAVAREAADATLQSNIDAEAAAREAADATLQSNIDAEAQARADADAALQSNIDAEAQARADADAALQSNIDAEAAAREAADDSLEQLIDAETTARREADTALQSAIDAETTARREADTALQSAIDAETTARREADTALQEQIDAETASRASMDSIQQQSIDMLDATKAEAWTGTQDEYDADKDNIEDGTIVLSPDELEDD